MILTFIITKGVRGLIKYPKRNVCNFCCLSKKSSSWYTKMFSYTLALVLVLDIAYIFCEKGLAQLLKTQSSPQQSVDSQLGIKNDHGFVKTVSPTIQINGRNNTVILVDENSPGAIEMLERAYNNMKEEQDIDKALKAIQSNDSVFDDDDFVVDQEGRK